MTIGAFAEQCGISVDTLRYYEKIGLMRPIQRDAARRRVFRSEDSAWIEFIKRLKDTGMPLTEIKRYADLREKGSSTLKERYLLLRRHAAVLADRMKADAMNLDQLKQKMAFYKREMARKRSP
jgi:DNA-binding transcriptional MerR regulator